MDGDADSDGRAAAIARAVFLDRDGVINRVVMRLGRPESPRTMSEFAFEPGVAAAVERLKAAGLRLFVVSNQPDLARGKLAPETVAAMTGAIMRALPIDAVRVCPHDDRDDCGCRKPRPGMLVELAREYGVVLGDSFMIGDSWKDMAAGRAAGCATIMLERDYNRGAAADYRRPTLADAAALIVSIMDGGR